MFPNKHFLKKKNVLLYLTTDRAFYNNELNFFIYIFQPCAEGIPTFRQQQCSERWSGSSAFDRGAGMC